MKTHSDIYGMMRTAFVQYLILHGCYDQMFCRICENNSYCGLDAIELAMNMIYEY